MNRQRRKRRRSTPTEVDSLELGLDMVCNAFGGIIFIVMLVAILTNQPIATAPQAAAPADLIRRNQLVAEISQVRNAVTSLSASLETVTVEDTTAIERASLKQEVDNAEAAVKDLGGTTEELRQAFEHESRLAAQRSATALALRHAAEQLNRSKPPPIKEERLPDLRLVRKPRFFLVLEGNRVYVPRRMIDGQLENNTDDFDVRERPGIIGEFRPRAEHGENLNTFVANSLATIQQAIGRDNFVIYIGLYPNSVASFNELRNGFTRNGYQYNWFGLAEGHSLTLVPTTDQNSASQ